MATYTYPKKNRKNIIVTIYIGSLILISLLTMLIINFQSSNVVIKRIPLPIIMEFITDFKSINTYLKGDKVALHERLQEKGIEEKIKNYYRPYFASEAELDQYIHQVFYEETGYVGKEYKVNFEGILENKHQIQTPNNTIKKDNFQGLYNHVKP